jgi:hypothetical protein
VVARGGFELACTVPAGRWTLLSRQKHLRSHFGRGPPQTSCLPYCTRFYALSWAADVGVPYRWAPKFSRKFAF